MASQDEVSRRRRVTYQQLESLLEFLNSHKEIAVGFNKSAQAREHSKRMWERVAESLNSQGEGATKDWKGWSNYWIDYKAKIKKRVAALHASQHRTGGGPADAAPLSDVEKRFLCILGEGFGTGLPGAQVDPFPNLAPLSEPVAGPSSINFQGNEVEEEVTACEEVPLPQQEATLPLHFVEEVVPLNTEEQPVTRSRRRRRQSSLGPEAARKVMVEVAKERLEVSKQKLEIMKNMLCTLNRIADSMKR